MVDGLGERPPFRNQGHCGGGMSFCENVYAPGWPTTCDPVTRQHRCLRCHRVSGRIDAALWNELWADAPDTPTSRQRTAVSVEED